MTPIRFQFSLRSWMLLISMLAAVPFLVFSAVNTYRLISEQQESDRTALQDRATAASAAVKRRVDLAAAALSAVAASRAAHAADIASMYDQAQRVIRAHPDATAISLVTPLGEQVFNTLRPFGAVLPKSGTAAYEEPVFTSGRSAFTPTVRSALDGRLGVSVIIPVQVDDRVQFVLRMTLPTEAFEAILREQQFPAEWITAVIDQQGLIVARTRESDRLAGTPASESFRKAIGQHRHGLLFETSSRDGTPLVGYVAEVGGTGWSVAIGVPRAAFLRELRTTMWIQVVASVMCLMLAGTGALLISRVIASEMQRLAEASMRLHADAQVDLPRGSVIEVNAVSGALAQAKGREKILHAQLETARLDGLTGLPGRQRFRELAERMIERERFHPERAVAMLYVDLDGFKGVNDRHGHEAGDVVLRRAAQLIREVIREEDIAGRVGGDEFVVCLAARKDLLAGIARSVAARLIVEMANIGFDVGCSVGIALRTPDRSSLDDLMADADAAMLEAKRAGKNAFVTFAGSSDRREPPSYPRRKTLGPGPTAA